MNTDTPTQNPDSDPAIAAAADLHDLPQSPPKDCPPESHSNAAGNRRGYGGRAVAALLLVMVLMLVWRRVSGHAVTVSSSTVVSGPQPVAVVQIKREDLFQEVIRPADFRPYLEVELHAKVSGYVQEMNVDFGDRVKAGQLLATLEVPELTNELDRAIAARKKAEADHGDAHRLFTRLTKVNQERPNLVTQQDVDSAEAKDLSTDASILGATAEVERYQTLMVYTRITAPFDGVVTARYADPGALIQAGTSSDTQSRPLVRVSDNYRLRLDVPVDVPYAKDIHLGDQVEVRVESLGGKTFFGKIRRTMGRVAEDTRTLTTEVEVENANLELVPGMYARVVLKVDPHLGALAVPIEAVSVGSRPTVFVVDADGGVEERPVTLGVETPTRFEVLSGLKEKDLVVIGHPGRLHPGQKVQAKLIDSSAQP